MYRITQIKVTSNGGGSEVRLQALVDTVRGRMLRTYSEQVTEHDALFAWDETKDRLMARLLRDHEVDR